MKITIRGTTDSLDPSNTCNNPEQSLANYNAELDAAILAEYPDAEIVHENIDDCSGIVVVGQTEDERAREEEVRDFVQRAGEDIYAAGNFWESAAITANKAREILAVPALTENQVARAIALASEDAKHWAAEAVAGTLPQVESMHLDWNIDADMVEAGVNDYAMQRLSFAIAEAAI